MSQLRYITRCNYQKTKGYIVRGAYKAAKDKKSEPTVQRFFSRSKYRTWSKTLEAAIAFRDANVPVPTTRPRWGVTIPGPGTISRVTLYYTTPNGDIGAYKAFACWIKVAPFKMRATKWSIDKWGSAVALDACRTWLRLRQKEQVQNYAKIGLHLKPTPASQLPVHRSKTR